MRRQRGRRAFLVRNYGPRTTQMTRARLWLLGGAVGLAVLAWSPAPAAETVANAAMASEARLRRDVTFLASDECEGRGPTTRGIDKAADYIAAEFKKAGLKLAGADGSYFQ